MFDSARELFVARVFGKKTRIRVIYSVHEIVKTALTGLTAILPLDSDRDIKSTTRTSVWDFGESHLSLIVG
jgi:hypothetical protein